MKHRFGSNYLFYKSNRYFKELSCLFCTIAIFYRWKIPSSQIGLVSTSYYRAGPVFTPKLLTCNDGCRYLGAQS
jgi:hypothetical protein